MIYSFRFENHFLEYQNLPQMKTLFRLQRVEVWITNSSTREQSNETIKEIVAIADLVVVLLRIAGWMSSSSHGFACTSSGKVTHYADLFGAQGGRTPGKVTH